MADEEQVKRPQQGVVEWNEWRAANRPTRVDLVGANLFGANLFGVDLFGANLCGTDLRRAFLDGANLSPAGGSPALRAPGPLGKTSGGWDSARTPHWS
jgi:hypothetical protein